MSSPRNGARRRPRLRAPSLGLPVLALATLVACVAPARPLRMRGPSAPTGPAEVPVQLTGLEGAKRLEVRVDGRAVVLTPGPAGVAADDGRSGARLTLGGPRSTVEVGGRRYSGTLVVEPRPGGGLRAIQRAPLEDYVAGVVAGELILWSARPAELEAQAIAARTFAVRRLEEGARSLRDDTGDQRYVGHFRPDSAAEQGIGERVRSAVQVTRGVVLVDDRGQLLDAHFHAACGGHTASPAVFGGPLTTGPTGVTCEPCAADLRTGGEDPARPLRWSITVPAEDWSRLCGRLSIGDRLLSLRPLRVDGDGRWLEVELTGNGGRTRVPFERLRAEFGHGRLPSSLVTRTWPRPGQPVQAGVLIEGVGRGHGVGLCQHGMHGYAREGLGGREILRHYFPGAHTVALGGSPRP